MASTIQLAERPLHVPVEAVYEFDMFHDPGLLADPHARGLELAAQAPPVFWTPCNGGHWMVVGYDEARQVLNDPHTFASSPFTQEKMLAIAAMMPPGAHRVPELVPVLCDPPHHEKLRAPLLAAFSPKAMMAIKGKIDEAAARRVAAVADQGECEFVAAVAVPFAAAVFLEMMGLPAAHEQEFRALIEDYFGPTVEPLARAMLQRKVADAILPTIVARKTAPRDDLISELWHTRIDGEDMTVERMEDYSAVLFVAGLGSIVDSTAFGIGNLARDPKLQSALKADPALIPAAAEELLRSCTPNTPRRRVVGDTTLGSCALKQEDTVLVYLLAANLDPKAYGTRDKTEPTGADKANLSFGSGPHRCPGASLARLELQAVYRAMITQLPPFRLDGERPPRVRGGANVTIASLPLVWNR